MSTSTSVLELAREAVDAKPLPAPKSFRLERLDVQNYVDFDGDPSLKVTAVIAEDTDLDQVAGQELLDVSREIRQRIEESGVKLFTYIGYVKQSELDDDSDIEDDLDFED